MKRPHYTRPIKMMNVNELATYLHVHKTTIYRLLKRRQLPGFRVGSKWRFDIESIDRWITRHLLEAERLNASFSLASKAPRE